MSADKENNLSPVFSSWLLISLKQLHDICSVEMNYAWYHLSHTLMARCFFCLLCEHTHTLSLWNSLFASSRSFGRGEKKEQEEEVEKSGG